MRIKQVKVEKLYTYGNYQNITYGFVADLDLGESPNTVIDHLNQCCDTQYAVFQGRLNEYEDIRHKINRLNNEKHDMEQDIVSIREKWERIKAFADKLDISLNRFDDDIPF